MGAVSQPKPSPVRPPVRTRPPLRIVETGPHAPALHLFTYTVGTALFWSLWAALSISADAWFWWIVVPLAAWTAVLALHLLHVYGSMR